jgi:hypothetical protein
MEAFGQAFPLDAAHHWPLSHCIGQRLQGYRDFHAPPTIQRVQAKIILSQFSFGRAGLNLIPIGEFDQLDPYIAQAVFLRPQRSQEDIPNHF